MASFNEDVDKSMCIPPHNIAAKFPDYENFQIKLKIFVVRSSGGQLELRGCVFSRSKDVPYVQSAFEAAQVELMLIWNYDPSVFFDIPHLRSTSPESDEMAHNVWCSSALQQCQTTLKPHQLTALNFLRKNESRENDIMSLWNQPTNSWLRSFAHKAGISMDNTQDGRSRGSILADNMGLGKTLTTLAYVLATSDAAAEFLWEDWINQSAATLVICPLATLSNWQNEINIHIENQAIKYHVFHGPSCNQLSKKDLQSASVVLTTYKMIGKSGSALQPNRLTIGSLNLCWFRIVLDEAQ
ncbi:hypothetical protein PTTG_27025 [Puccinia triticina 1-1 BBBD Race 1]|uniref:SNF2_N domain-containing protein n=1 Tax=Puccinia triticina (isolate 1-1 / race 1 (BBBD)) TaxID=630390 RepID=A0A180GNL2_PUCT1|nr:hypothetical protein PTTG_27025 [Puccinia triticina 1-1 BBBD Race 1]